MSRWGPLGEQRALALLGFFGLEAKTRRESADPDGARYCALRARELALALIAADDWRRAARAA